MSSGRFEPEIIHDFVIESGDLLDQFERDLEALESGVFEPEMIHRAFRTLHTIKGNASFLSLTEIVDLAHAAERALDATRVGRASDACGAIQLIKAALGVLDRQLEQVRAGRAVEAGSPDLLDALGAIGHDSIVNVGESASHVPSVSSDSEKDTRGLLDGEPGLRAPVASIRVEVGRLEALICLARELMRESCSLSMLTHAMEVGSTLDAELLDGLKSASQQFERVTSELQHAMMHVRMQPVERLFGKYARVIRDLARRTGKQIQLVVEGGQTELDTSVLDALSDPFVHFIRNCADHGIEMPEERTATGKDATGTIILSAHQEDGFVVIMVRDDGRGLSREKIANKVVACGLVSDSEIASMSDAEVFRFIFAPGFTTADQVSELSGWGVGLDVVRTNIEMLGGEIAVESITGGGTTMRVRIPLSIAMLPVCFVEVAGEVYALPAGTIENVKNLSTVSCWNAVRWGVLRVDDRIMPVVDAVRAFGVSNEQWADPCVAVVLRVGENRAALLSSRVCGYEAVVVRPAHTTDASGFFPGSVVGCGGQSCQLVDVEGLVRRTVFGRREEAA